MIFFVTGSFIVILLASGWAFGRIVSEFIADNTEIIMFAFIAFSIVEVVYTIYKAVTLKRFPKSERLFMVLASIAQAAIMRYIILTCYVLPGMTYTTSWDADIFTVLGSPISTFLYLCMLAPTLFGSCAAMHSLRQNDLTATSIFSCVALFFSLLTIGLYYCF